MLADPPAAQAAAPGLGPAGDPDEYGVLVDLLRGQRDGAR